MDSFKGFREALREFDELTNIAEIGRRYFAMNAFDGTLTIIGVVVGNLVAGVDRPQIVLSTGLATCIAMGISGLWGAYLTETAERKRALDELGRQTLVDLSETRIGRASQRAAIAVAVIDGLSPFLAALLVLVPFFFAGLFPAIEWVYYSSLGAGLLTLAGLGAFLGYISRQNLIISGIRTVVAGLVSIAISLLLGE
jgi:predicted membrane protein (TIGR00267 family)